MRATGAGASSLGEFELGVDFLGDRSVLCVRGEVDCLTAPMLAAVLRVLVDGGRADVTLDLAALTFMDASGLRVMAGASARLATSKRVLTVRSAPAMTRRILGITRLDEFIRLERDDRPPQSVETESHAPPANLAGVNSKLGNTVVDAALRLLTVLADANVEGADGVSVTLARGGRLTTVASSNETVLRMDGHQYETGEGPCLAAATQGRGFHIESLADENRWPAFVPRAIDQGIASILSTPVMAGERAVGALNIYSTTERAFGAEQQQLATTFASHAAEIVTDAGVDVSDEQMAEQIADALVSREVIAQAQGILMAGGHASAEDAAASLHRSARSARASVREHAVSIIDSVHSDKDQDKRAPNG